MSAGNTTPGPLRLGFGCSSLGSEIGYRESCALVDAAYEAGFRHFDVAPPYGQGMAERILGDVLGSVRKHITLVSKAGIAHPRSSDLLLVARQLALPLKRRFPGIWKRAAAKATHAAVPRGRFGAGEVLASLDESLRRLRTEYLDALLLHEVQPGDIDETLAETLQRVRGEGRVRAIGTGTGVDASVALLARHSALIDWVQTNHYWGAFLPALRATRWLATHRSLRTGVALLRRAEFAAALQLDGTSELAATLTDQRTTRTLLLRAALAQVGDRAVVLVSTTRRERLRELLGAAATDPTPALTSSLNRVFQRCVTVVQNPESLTA